MKRALTPVGEDSQSNKILTGFAHRFDRILKGLQSSAASMEEAVARIAPVDPRGDVSYERSEPGSYVTQTSGQLDDLELLASRLSALQYRLNDLI